MRVREDFYPQHYLDAITPIPVQERGGLVKVYIYVCTGRRGAVIPWPEEGAAVMGDPSAPGAGDDPPWHHLASPVAWDAAEEHLGMPWAEATCEHVCVFGRWAASCWVLFVCLHMLICWSC